MTSFPAATSRSRFGLLFMPVAVIVGAIAWSGFWFFASAKIGEQLDGWRAREAKSGRIYDCGKRAVSGFPFRFEVRCSDVSVVLLAQTAEPDTAQTRLVAKLAAIAVVAQVYDPKRLIADFTGPVTLAERGERPFVSASWSKGRSSVLGLPEVPQRTSLEFDNPAIDLVTGPVPAPLFRGKHVEAHARLAEGSAADNPVIEAVLQIAQGSVQAIHPLFAEPFDADIRVMLRGLKDFSPKPWPDRFREIQAAGGRIDVVQSRISQKDFLSVAAGSLGISPGGLLNGELQMTIAGVEKIAPALGIDKLLQDGVSQQQVDRVARGVSASDVNKLIGALNKAIPGLDRVVKQGIDAGLAQLGPATTLEGRKAQNIPVRFVDGNVFVGPLRVGQIPPLF
ncbi:MAG: DUF2125 domain-containing protein [Pseudomonadota bacterium]